MVFCGPPLPKQACVEDLQFIATLTVTCVSLQIYLYCMYIDSYEVTFFPTALKLYHKRRQINSLQNCTGSQKKKALSPNKTHEEEQIK